MPASANDDFLSRPLLRQLAAEKTYVDGEQYVTDERVRQIQFGLDRVTAKVAGTRVYRVKIWRGRGELHFACTCPVGREHVFCKHCVAVGLTWVQSAERARTEGSAGANPNPANAKDAQSRDKLRRHLQAQERDRLISLILEATDYDDILRRRLVMETIGVAGRPAGRPPDFAAYRQILHDAIDAPDYVDYDAMSDYVHGVAEAVQPLGELLRAGHAAAVIDLVELALVALDRASEMIDASDGSLNAVYDDLQLFHLEACRAARLDPEKLAARLLNFELEGGLGVFNNAAKTYAEILGPAGVAAWRKLLIREWSRLPTLAPPPAGGKATTPPTIDYRRFQVQALMENLAVTEGDLETLTAVKQRDLSTPQDFLSLAESHRAAGHLTQGLSWAERGLQAFPDLADSAGLRDFLTTGYHAAGRHDAAAALVWAQFASSPGVELFAQLKIYATPAGDGWPAWRERALKFLREYLGRKKERGLPTASDRSLLVEVLLVDGEVAEAWREAQAGGCSSSLWLQLAERREGTHPADALRIYQERLGPMIAQGGPRGYKDAIGLLAKISALLEDLGRAAEFDVYRAEVRATHRQKRNFVKLLDASGH